MNATHSLVQLRHAAPMPIGRILRAYAKEVKYESLRMLRSPAFAIPFLLLPVPVYLFFGVMLAGPAVAKNPGGRELSLFGILGVRCDGACALRRRLCARGRARRGLSESQARAARAGRRVSHREDADVDGLCRACDGLDARRGDSCRHA